MKITRQSKFVFSNGLAAARAFAKRYGASLGGGWFRFRGQSIHGLHTLARSLHAAGYIQGFGASEKPYKPDKGRVSMVYELLDSICKGAPAMIEIIEVDQYTSTGNLSALPFDELTLDAITGGDSEAAKLIFGGAFARRIVEPNASPRIGCVWFTRGPDGLCEFYRANYDSSD